MTATDSSFRRRRQAWWEFNAQEARTITRLISGILAVSFVVMWSTGNGVQSIFGPLKGGDFVFFYTAGTAGRVGAPLYDFAAIHELQIALIPQSHGANYLPIYPPQIYVLFAPLSLVPYTWAALLWVLCSAAIYMGVVYASWSQARDVLPDGRFVMTAAAAFFPFFSLLGHAQSTPFILLAFYGAFQSLAHGRRILAGAALGLLFIKPTWGMALAAVVLVHREWRILAGLALSAAVQYTVTAAILGPSAFVEYVRFAQAVAPLTDLLEPKPHDMHSLRSIVVGLPDVLRTAIWLLGSIAVIYGAVRTWVADVPLGVRMGCLVVASALVNPHLTTYDATVLILPCLWWAAWVMRDGPPALAADYGTLVTATFVAFLIPFALIVFVQVSVFVVAYFYWRVTRAALSTMIARAG